MNEQLDAMILSYPDFPHCAIQTFCDDKSREDAKTMARIFSQDDPSCWSMIEDLNKKGAWVFFSVNSMQLGKRDKASLTRFNSWICEIDHLEKEEQLKLIDLFPLYPSLIVESCHGFHMYWYIKFPEDMTAERRSKINWWLCNFFSGDPKIPEDTARVLRVPSFYHMKDPANPYLISIYGGSSLLYTEEQMLSVLTDFRSLSDKKESVRKMESDALNDDDNFWHRVNAMDCKTMLSALSWSDFVKWDIITFKKNSGDTEQIFCNGRSTSCWIDANGKIGSYDGGWPHRTSWVAWYGVSWKELYRWVIDHYPEMKPEQKKTKTPEKDQPSSGIWRTTDSITWDFSTNRTSWGLDYIDDNFMKFDPGGELVVLFGLPGSWKTELWFFIARHSQTRTAYFCLEIPEETIIKRWALRSCWFTMQQVDNWALTEPQKAYLQTVTNNFKNSIRDKIDMISITKQPTIEELLARMKDYAGQWHIIIIDNLWKILGDDNENIRFADITAKLQTFAYETRSVVILQHHGSKPPRSKNTSLDSMEDIVILWPYWFRWSQKVYDNATRMVEIYRDRRANSTWLIQYKHTPTDATWTILLEFVWWEFLELT